MEDSDSWRARRAAELVGTPFERPTVPPQPLSQPQPPSRDRVDDTLPMPRSEPAVFAVGARTTSASPPRGGPASTRATQTRPVLWWLAAAGVLAVLAAIVVATFSNRRAPDQIAQTEAVSPPPSAFLPPASPHSVQVPTAASPRSVVPPTAIPQTAASRTIVAKAARTIIAPTSEALTPHANVAHGPSSAPSHLAKAATVPHDQSKLATQSADIRPHGPSPRGAVVLPVITISAPRCTPSSSRIELVICASPTLLALDRQRHDLYADVLAEGDQRQIAKALKSEASFIRKRDRSKDEGAVAKAYGHHINALQKLRKKVAITQARAAEQALPVCSPGQPQLATCRPARRHFSLRRLFGAR